VKKQIPIKNIVVTFFVRTGLNMDHVDFLRDLYNSEEPVDPIKVLEINHEEGSEKFYELIDGRHRIEASKKAGFNTILADVNKDEMDIKSKILNAVIENTGGALPPTLADFEHTMELLLAAKCSRREIVENFPLPKGVTEKFYKATMNRIYKRTIRNAVEAVIKSDLTIKQAAEKFNVKVEDLKYTIQHRQEREKNVDNILKGLESSNRGVSHSWAARTRTFIELYENGEIGKNDIARVVKRIDDYSKKIEATLQNCKSRLQAAVEPKVISKEKAISEILLDKPADSVV